MNVLITGGLGTIGRALSAECLARGHRVATCDLFHTAQEISWSGRFNAPPEQSYSRCDVADYRQLQRVLEAFGGFDLVYHCAAEFGRWNGEDYYEQLWRTNAVGTKNVLRLQEQFQFKLVYFSSSEVYGDWPGIMVESVMAEEAVQQLNDYALSKWVGEMQIRNSTSLYETETVIVRLFNTYGPGEYYSPYRSVNCRFLYCALHGLPWTVHRGHSRTSTYVDDTVRTLANLAEKFIPGEVYNIAGVDEHSIEDLSDIVLDVTAADPQLVRYAGPEFQTTQHKSPDISKAVRDLGHHITCDLRTGMAQTAEWMKDVYRKSVHESLHLHGHP